MNEKIIEDLEEIKLRMEAFFSPDGAPPEDTGEFRELKGAIKMMEYVLRSLEDTRHEAPEPKDCGFTLATCPYERCSGITMRAPKAEEPLALDGTGCCPKCGLLLKDMSHESLAVLADRKGYSVETMHDIGLGVWRIVLRGPAIRVQEGIGCKVERCSARTYPECEAKARAFLMGLPDKGEAK